MSFRSNRLLKYIDESTVTRRARDALLTNATRCSHSPIQVSCLKRYSRKTQGNARLCATNDGIADDWETIT